MVPTLHWVDYLIFGVFLATSLGIGFYHSITGGKQRTIQEFIMADRNLHVLPTMLSIIASSHSAIMILGQTAEMYNWGIQAWFGGIIFIIVSISITERIIVPWIYPLRLTSTYEYLYFRFQSRPVAILGAAIGIIKATLYMGISIYAPSIALEAAVGFPAYASIPIMAVICTIYTALGGMRAVIWTDVLQFFIMLAGMMAVLIKGNMAVGGFGRVLDYCEEEGRLNGMRVTGGLSVRHTLWTFIFGSVPAWTMVYGLDQASVQRYSATRSLKQARITTLLNLPTALLVDGIACMTGLTVFAYFAMIQCDPLQNGNISSSNQILTYFVRVLFHDNVGFSGLFLATLYSGALSSVSSSLSGSAANMWESILKYWFTNLSDQTATKLNKVLVVVFGALATGIAFLASTMPGPVTQISQTFGGAAGGPLLGMFLLGGIFPFVEWKGAMTGGVCGLLLNLWIGIGSYTVPSVNTPLPPTSTEGCQANTTLFMSTMADTSLYTTTTQTPTTVKGISRLYTISYLWYAPIGCVTCLITGSIASLLYMAISKSKPLSPPSRYLIQWKTACTCNDKLSQDSKQNGALEKKNQEMAEMNNGHSHDGTEKGFHDICNEEQDSIEQNININDSNANFVSFRL